MTDDNKDQQERKPLTLKTLSLKKSSDQVDQVRQSFSHGRSKSVTVEVVKKKRQSVGDLDPKDAEALMHGNKLNSQELEARLHALKSAMKTDENKEIVPNVEDIIVSQHAHKVEIPQEAEVETKPVAQNNEEVIDNSVVEAEESVVIKQKDSASFPKTEHRKSSYDLSNDDNNSLKKSSTPRTEELEQKKMTTVRKDNGLKNLGKASMNSLLQTKDDEESSQGFGVKRRSQASIQRARTKYRNKSMQGQQEPQAKVIREVILPEAISVQDLANRMAERAGDVVKSLMKMGVMANINQIIDADTAELIAAEFGHSVKRVADSDVEIGIDDTPDNPEDIISRAPVVTVMGHVDHGKTSLLDALRSTDIVASEAGGITQHIGAYQVTMSTGAKITFIDTPGHAAFTQMRARGANVTDVVVLVVAADDGIKEQTVEAIQHAKAAGVPIVVAINKIDKPGSDAERVKQEMLMHGLVVEELGGDVLAIPVSAKKRTNLEKLEEAILLQAEVLDLKANPSRSAKGVVVEARLEKGRGSVATVLIQAGTLRVGDIFVAGNEWGKVRALIDDHGHKLEKALPSMPVEVLGFDKTPLAGDDFTVVESEYKAREISDFRSRRKKDALSAAKNEILRNMFANIGQGQKKELSVVIKSDVGGSLEAISSSLQKLENEEVTVKVLFGAVGGITESDITLAKASQALVIGFNVRANPQARDMAKRDGIEVRYYSIIYDVIDDARAILSGMLSPTLKENYLGTAEMRQIFQIPKVGKIAGCMVKDGVIKRGEKVRLLRDNVVIHEGTLKTLKRFKDEVKEVRENYECGMAFENYSDIREGDMIECFEIQEIQRTL